MNKDINETVSFMNEFNALFLENKSSIGNNIEFGFASPSISISTVKSLSKYNKYIGAENTYFLDKGSVTGEISPQMAISVGANFIIVGHSERRAIFNETDEIINKKMKAVLASGVVALLCVGETLDEYKAGKTKQVVSNSIIKCLEGINDFSKVIIAYEPVWAIGTGETATPEQAQEVCAYIRTLLKDKSIPIQYGGSVKPENVKEILAKPDIDGALVGGASLDPKLMIGLLTLNAK